MRRGALLGSLLAFVLAAPGPAAGQPAAPRTLRPRARLDPGPYYVGQALTLEVGVAAEGADTGDRPRVATPKVAGAEVTPLGNDAGSGGSPLIIRFRVVPRRPGLLVIPAVTARSADRSGTTAPVRATVRKLPESGRTEAFLGGVGPFEITAEAHPATVRRGGMVEYCLRVTGPAALGMTGRPDARKLIRNTPGVSVEAGAVEAVADPPSRRFCYRVRPTRPGDFVIPPVSIASFDPRIGGYQTRASLGVPVHVLELERFDPSTLDDRPRPEARGMRAVATGAGALALFGLALLVLRRMRGRRRREGHIGPLLAGLARILDQEGATGADLGRAVTEGLAEYLRLTIGRPPGALTPDEARDGIARATRDPATGERAGRLVSRCDQAQFGFDGSAALELAGEARSLLADLGRSEETRGFETPREAAVIPPP